MVAVPNTCWSARVVVAPAPQAAELSKVAEAPSPTAVELSPVATAPPPRAVEFVPVVRETKLVAVLEEHKKQGVWMAGAVPKGGVPIWEADLGGPICLVLGGEGPGLRPLVARTCDLLLTLPMLGRVGSLNVAAAGAVVCYEVLRQRRASEEKRFDFGKSGK